MLKRNDLDVDLLKEYFMYDDGKLIWIKRPSINSRQKIGDRAGSLKKLDGYRNLELKGKYYREHRIIWTILKGQIPEGFDIDHINGIRDDNHIENMRLVSHRQNIQNLSCHREGKILGVHYNKEENFYTSHITYQKKSLYLGCFSNEESANETYLLACKLIENGQDPEILVPIRFIKGYVFDRRANSYGATIKVNGKAKYLGNFKTAKEAHAKYLEAKDKLSRGETL